MTVEWEWQDYEVAPIFYYGEDQPDLRPRPDEQVPHLLVIESIDYRDAHMSELWVECPVDHLAARHWCSEDIYVTFKHAFKLVGAVVHVNFRTLVGCWITTDVENTGVLEMLGVPAYPRNETPWPDDFPQKPGTYPVFWCSDGYGEDHNSWLELR